MRRLLPTLVFLAATGASAQLPALPLPTPKGVYALDSEPFLAQARSDLVVLRRYSDALTRADAELSKQTALYKQRGDQPYSPEQKRALLTAFGSLYNYAMSTEAIRQRYSNEYLQFVSKDRVRHDYGFLLSHTALTLELFHGLRLADQAVGHPQLEVVLDEPNPEFGVPARAFAELKLKVLHVSSASKLFAGSTYSQRVLPALRRRIATGEPNLGWALNAISVNSRAARTRLLTRGPTAFVRNAADIIKDGALDVIFPVQKGIAEWMGDTRVRREGQPLISAEQVQVLLAELQPGDILVARQNWFISNIGLPGFWPHAELYASTPVQLSAYFDGDPEVRAFLAAQPEKPARFVDLIAARFPDKWKKYSTGQDLLGSSPLRIIEAISEGVSFTGVEHGMQVDYLGVMRPRLPKVEKAKAILRAFGYQGRPYDFDFDFFSDQELVCTELVYKSYAPSAELKGLKLPLVSVAGRMTLPANDIVRLFDQEYDQPNRQLDFVAFLDGREQSKAAVRGDLASFRKSHQRPKWDVVQK